MPAPPGPRTGLAALSAGWIDDVVELPQTINDLVSWAEASGVMYGVGTEAARPSATTAGAGRFYLCSDTGEFDFSDGSAWLPIARDNLTVTALPTNNYSAREIVFRADSTNGIEWRLKYRPAASAPYRWEFIGGSAMAADIDTSDSVIAGVGFVDPAHAGPQLTLPLAGVYDFEFGFSGSVAGVGADVQMSLSLAGAAAANTERVYFENPVAAAFTQANARRIRRTLAAPGSVVKAMYAANVSSGTVFNRWLRAIPVRVG